MVIGYSRFDIDRPEYLSDEYWACVEQEIIRLARSLDADDGGQVLSDLKCLVECIAKIVLDIDGNPASSNAAYADTVKRAHRLLADQPGHELVNQSAFGQIATQANKMVGNLGTIRNDYGGGHGRGRPPALKDEMVTLALDGGLLWVRWALRRVGYFALGRPEPIIEALVGTSPSIFRAGWLKRRLLAANLPALEPRYQRSIGVAVGQRLMSGTFVVRADGLDPVLESDDLTTWPRGYRLGLTHGMWFDETGRPTLTPTSVENGLKVLDPVSDCADELDDLVGKIETTRPQGPLGDDFEKGLGAQEFVVDRVAVRPEAERPALERLARNIFAAPF